MVLAHADIELACPLAVVLAERAVLQSICVGLFILAPQQIKCDMCAAQFAVDISPVRLGALHAGTRLVRKQTVLKCVMAHLKASGVFNTGHFSTPEIVAHRGGAGFDDIGNLPIGEF